jgi:uridine monophosphate synthetase
MASFFSWLTERVHAVNSLLCVGLDPLPQDLPVPTAEAAAEFCYRLIRCTANQAACFKPNVAFFEVFGSQGVEALRQVIASIPRDIPVILDAKRGDIASTAQAYAQSVFHTFGAHSVTVNPYLGHDSIEPFLLDPEKGVFLLCKTSNPGSADLQDLLLVATGGHADVLYEEVARLAQGWNRQDNLGLVIGATQPEALRRVRAIAPDLWILAPGVGAQGGDLETALAAGLRQDGLGLLLPVSRLLSRSPDPGVAAQNLRLEINKIRERIIAGRGSPVGGMEEHLCQLADKLLVAGCIQFGHFTLKSGLESPVYIDLRRLVSDPVLLSQVAATYLPVLKDLSFDHLAALPYAAIPIATSISLLGGWSLIYPRKEVKSYGTRVEIEGVFQAGERVVVIDDLATTGGSKFEAIKKLSAAGLRVRDVVVLVDRQSGASEALSSQGYQLHAIFSLSDLLDYWEVTGKVSPENIHATRLFLSKGNADI